MNVDPLQVIAKLSAKLADANSSLAMTEVALDQALELIVELENKLNNPEPENASAAKV